MYIVTGGAGFIGSHVVKELVRRGAKVRVIDNLSTGHKENLAGVLDKIDFIHADINEVEASALRAVDVILHQAALASVERSVRNPIETEINNVLER